MDLFVKAKNFLSFGDEGFERDFNKYNGLVFISGENRDSAGASSNGAGKSSILDAILWGFFGVTSRGLRYDEVINTNIGKNCYVSVIFTLADEKYEIVRTRNHDEFNNSLRFLRWDDDEPENLTGHSISSTQDKINDVLGLDDQTMQSTIVFGQGVDSFVDYRESDRNEIITKLLSYDYLDLLKEEAKSRQRREKEKIEDISSKLQSIKGELKSLNDLDYESDIEKFEKDRKKRIKNLKQSLEKEKNKRDVKLDNLIKDIEEHCKETDKKISHFSEAVENRKERLLRVDEIISDRDKASLEKKLHNAEDAKDEILQSFSACKSVLGGIKKDLKRFKDLDIGECPKCGQEVTDEHKDECVKEFEDKRAEQQKKFNGLKKKSDEITSIIERIKSNIKEVEGFEEEKRDLVREIKDKEKDIRKLKEDKKEGVNRVKKDKKEIENNFKERKGEIKDGIETIAEEKNPFDKLLSEKNHKVEKLTKLIETHEDYREEYEEKYRMLTDWVEAFGPKGIRNYLFDDTMNLLDERIYQYMDILSDGAVSVNIETEKELKSGEKRNEFNIVVSDSDGERVYQSYSGGEKKRVKLAIDLALSDVVCEERGSDIDFVAFDEVLSSLDSVGAARAVEMWKEQIETGKKRLILVIDHNIEIKNLFDDEICVIKEDGVSYCAVS